MFHMHNCSFPTRFRDTQNMTSRTNKLYLFYFDMIVLECTILDYMVYRSDFHRVERRIDQSELLPVPAVVEGRNPYPAVAGNSSLALDSGIVADV